MQMTKSETHDALAPISWLSGKWVTKEGQGKFPNITDFSYQETLEFTCIGQPMYNFLSTSIHPEKHTPMHQERGFLRIKPGTEQVAFIVSHNFGLTTIEEGHCNAITKEIELESVNIVRMSFAKPPKVTRIKRLIKLLAVNVLEVKLFMETEETVLTEHLSAVYNKISD